MVSLAKGNDAEGGQWMTPWWDNDRCRWLGDGLRGADGRIPAVVITGLTEVESHVDDGGGLEYHDDVVAGVIDDDVNGDVVVNDAGDKDVLMTSVTDQIFERLQELEESCRADPSFVISFSRDRLTLPLNGLLWVGNVRSLPLPRSLAFRGDHSLCSSLVFRGDHSLSSSLVFRGDCSLSCSSSIESLLGTRPSDKESSNDLSLGKEYSESLVESSTKGPFL